MQHYSQLGPATAQWAALSLTGLTPRRPLELADKQADWKSTVTQLQHFARSSDYRAPQQLHAHAALECSWHWQRMAAAGCQLLIYGIDLGLPGAVLRPVLVEVVALWKDLSQVLNHARSSMQAVEPGFGVPAPLAPRTGQYREALILLSLAVLLDAQEEIPAIVEQLLAFDTDRLLDYLSAAMLDLEEASDDCFHPHPYAQLTPFFDQLGDAPSPAPLVAYLQSQYHDHFLLPAKKQTAGGRIHCGAWALEVAALSVLYGWDDAPLRAFRHYPGDLVDFARAAEDMDPGTAGDAG